MIEPKTNPRDNGEQSSTGSFRFEKQILNTSSIGVLITRISDGTILYANKAIGNLLGIASVNSIIGQLVPDFYWDPADRHKLLELFRAEGSVTSNEMRARQANGSMIWASISLQPFQFEGEQALLAEIVDNTERKQAEDAVKESQQKLSLLIDSSPLAFIEWNANFEVVSWNPAAERIFGYAAAEAKGNHARFIIPPEFHIYVDQVWEGLITQTGGARATNANVTKSGQAITCEWYNTPLAGSDGKVFGVSSLVEDVTDSKYAEEKAIQLQSAMEQTGDGIALADLNGNILYANPAWAELHGYTVDEIQGKHLSIFHSQEQLKQEVIPFNNKVMEIGKYSSEIGHVRKDGSLLPTLMTTVVQKDENGNPVGLIGTIRDITESKKAAELLQLSEANLSSALRVAKMGYWELDIPTQMFTFNDQYYSLLGIDAQKVGGYQMSVQQFAQQYVPPEESAVVQASIVRAIETTDPNFQIEFETRNLRADGTPIWTTVWFRIQKNEEGQTVKTYGVSQDITERKRLEREVQEAFERRGYQVQVSTEISQEVAAASELSELFARVVTLTKERLGYYHTQLLRYESAKDAVVLISGYGETGRKMLASGHQMPLGSGLIGTAAASGETILRSSLADDPDWQPNPLLPDTQGEIAVPIKLGKQVLGVLDIQSDQAGALTEDDRLLLEGLCGQIAVAIEQTRLRQEMTERLEEVNRLYQTMSHEGWKTYRENADLPEGFVFDQEGTRPVNEDMANEGFANIPMRVLGGEVVGTLTVADDPKNPTSPEDYAFLQQVSDQIALALEGARLSAQTQSALAQSETLFEASRKLAQASDLQDLLKTTIETFNIPVINGAELNMFSYDVEGELESLAVVANWWNGTGKEPGAIGSRYPKAMFSAVKLFLTSTPVFISDTSNNENMDASMQRIVKAFNIHAATFLPLFVGTHQIGVLVMHAEEPHSFTEEETRLFAGLAPQIATVLDNRRQFERAQQQAERETALNIISQKIQSATTVEAVLQIAARELGHALGAPMTVAQLNMRDKQ